MIRKSILFVFGSSQHSNTVFIMAAQAIITLLGFLFWVVVSRVYKTEAVGVASSLISATLFLSQISVLGLNQGLVRFLPKAKNKEQLITTCLLPTIVSSLLLGVAVYYVWAVRVVPDGSSLLLMLFFVLATVLATVNLFTDSVFLAARQNIHNIVIYGAYGVSRMVAPLLFVAWGAMGIFCANLVGLAAAVTLSGYYMYKKLGYRPSLKIDKKLLQKVGGFAFISYLSGFFWIAPLLIVPIIVIGQLGAQTAAHLYIVVTVFNALLIPPTSATQSLYAEGSHADPKALHRLVKHAFLFTISLQLVSVIGVISLGGLLMSIFGTEYYKGGLSLLYVLAPCSFITILNMLGNTIMKVRQRMRHLLVVNGVGALFTLLAFLYLLPKIGLVGVGVGYGAGQALMAVCYMALFLDRGLAVKLRVSLRRGYL